jgi:hypothetical protein
MPFIILLPSGKNIWQLFLVFTLLGVAFYFLSESEKTEANTYKDGPKTADVQTLNAQSLEYNYLSLTGLSDSYYIYKAFAEDNDEDNVDTEKAIVLYYALHTLEELDASIAGEQSRPAVVVRQTLPAEERACVETEEGCLAGGEMTLEGRLSKDVPYPDDKEGVDRLAKDGLYTLDNTLYFDADWQPKTVAETASGGSFWMGWIVVGGLLTAFMFYKSRRKNVTNPPVQEQA